MPKNLFKIIGIAFLMLVAVLSFNNEAHAASSPYDVDSAVKKDWNEIYGGRSYTMQSGKALVYDIYSEKYSDDGYKIVKRDFGKGEQKYIRFQGWAVLTNLIHIRV